ncbi:hypothetical protein DEU56DRAFT_503198 [Suillus clintonianus]|uniref:uncharacterized protein n=1 Tax=Suillus clintonianus TaxID=1904413 RepID=UPI001B885436|nr:uncharacterized protein DEU56DRAFT_503198 [Suillus clintonianus]KAG2129017.1 hypothetical protein DEU56DRAFT_503198 [Suillus clintonianus]
MPHKAPFEIYPGYFNLNVSGVAGFFGGEEAISAMQTIHLYKHRKWLGWYNSPGSWNVGKKFGLLANSRLWDGLFPGPNEDPAKFFELDGKQGPKYVASRSGSILERTGHLAYLIMQTSKEELGVQVQGRVTKPNKVTIIKTQPIFKESTEKEKSPVRAIPPHSGHHTDVAILPIAVSFTTCALCGWTYDWFCCSMILLGIVSNGMSSLVIGSAHLKLQGVKSAPTAPPGDGMLMDGDDIVLLTGKEENIATITRGKFMLDYEPWVRKRSRKEKRKRSVPGDGMGSTNSNRTSDAEAGLQDSSLDRGLKEGTVPVRDEYAAIGLCSLLLVIQLLGQLLLIPQGTFFGQIMFLASFAASWAYNLYLSSIDKEYIQERLLLNALNLDDQHMRTYILGTRTTAAVFACLMLQPPDISADKWEEQGFKPESIIRNFIPNDTPVWVIWRKKVLDVMGARIRSQEPCHSWLQMSNEDIEGFKKNDKDLLGQLLEDARIAYDLATNEQWLVGEEK